MDRVSAEVLVVSYSGLVSCVKTFWVVWNMYIRYITTFTNTIHLWFDVMYILFD